VLRDGQRLSKLRLLQILDSPPEEAFDRLTRLATRVLGVPVALVSLVDGERQFFKSQQGLPEPWACQLETPLSHSFCQHVVTSAEALVVEDARLDPELCDNLAIRDIGVVAYAGIPLTTPDGHTLGSFCAIDSEPRAWSEDDLEVLRDLAASAMTEIELRDVLLRSALHDAVTSLPTRNLFVEHVQRALLEHAERRERVVVIKVALDGFRRVNEAFGHAAGDEVLLQAAHRLDAFKDAGDVLARLHGDRFGLLVTGREGDDEVLALAQRVLGCFSEPFAVASAAVHVAATVGIAVAGDGLTDEAAVLDQADLAIHRGKEHGGARVAFAGRETSERAMRLLTLETQLRGALARGELRVAFQPIVELRAPHRVLAAEALVRWHSDVLGPLSPAEFIPIAESSELIVPIGRWVLREACRRAAGWSQRGPVRVGVSVNLSPRQLEDDIVATVRSAIDDARLPADLLTLEITETVLLDDSERTTEVLRQLRALGPRMVLDDFGTGFSSLSLLKRGPVSGVKIDRQFVAGLPHSRDDRAICEAVIHMARAMDLSTVAEGVETRAQATLLEDLGADFAQGFLFGRPAHSLHHDRA